MRNLTKEKQMKNIYAVVLTSLLVAGCANVGDKAIANKSPSAEANKPKPVSTVFNRPAGPTTIEFTSDGQFISITARASAPIAGNNAYSIEQATSVATLRARRNIAEFMGAQLNTTRTLKVLSHTVQKSAENTANGMDADTVINDKDFNSDGNEAGGPADSLAADNVNSEKIAQTLKETINSSSTAILRGVVTSDETINASGRTVTVEVKASVNTIGAAGSLRKLMEQMGN
jgi:hypothetical protein